MGKRINGFMKRKVPVHIAVMVILLFLMAGTLMAFVGSGHEERIAKTIYTRTLRALHMGQTIPYPLTIGTTTEPLEIKASTLTYAGAFQPNPVNYISNASLSIWSGGTNSAASTSSAPDGWYLWDTTNTGATLYNSGDSSAIIARSGLTAFNGFPHAMYVESAASYGQEDYMGYPESGVSREASWYQQFLGKKVQFGALVWTDSATSGATDFIKAYIMTQKSGTSTAAALSSDFAGGGWEYLSATTTVPLGATCLEGGFLLNGTALSGPSAFIVGPTFVSDGVMVSRPIVKRNETVYFTDAVGFVDNGPTFDLVAGTSSFNLARQGSGKIPEDVSALYVIYQGEFSGANHQSSFRSDTSHLTGATFYSSALTGATLFTHSTWVPTDYAGDFDLYTSAAVNGVSIFITGAQLR